MVEGSAMSRSEPEVGRADSAERGDGVMLLPIGQVMEVKRRMARFSSSHHPPIPRTKRRGDRKEDGVAR